MNRAQKYARAYLNVFGSQLRYEDIERFEGAAAFLEDHRRALFLLKVPIISKKVKHKGIHELCKRFELRESVVTLINLLLRHNALFLIADVLYALAALYRKDHAIHLVHVTSSLDLTDAQKSYIENFLRKYNTGIHRYAYSIDKTLIAGVRIQSDTILWEGSIKKQLDTILQTCM